MARTAYECMFLFDPNAYARNPAGVSESIEKIVGSVDGEILASRLWNEQKLAYPINGHRKGAYWLAYVNMESTALPKFTRQCQLNDRLMRHLAVKVDPRLLDTLVAAAQGRSVEPETKDEKKSTVTDNGADSTSKPADGADDAAKSVAAETVES